MPVSDLLNRTWPIFIYTPVCFKRRTLGQRLVIATFRESGNPAEKKTNSKPVYSFVSRSHVTCPIEKKNRIQVSIIQFNDVAAILLDPE